jgi:prepilin-type N-terminal cleavage/methylation domain-containing protein
MNKRPRGMTLLELTVVLAILAIVTGIAVTSMTAVEDQTRHDQTAELLGRIERAIVGGLPSETADDPSSAVTFFGDTGHLPRAVGSDPATLLSELWIKPADFVEFRLRTPAVAGGDAADVANLADLLVGSGWRGPYLRLPGSGTALLDGYGNGFACDFVPDTFAIPGQRRFIKSLESLGSDNLNDTPTPAADYTRDIPGTGPVRFFDETNPGEFYPSLNITVTQNGGSLAGDTRVYLVCPDATNPNGSTVQKATLSSANNFHTFTAVPAGYRMIRIVDGTKKYTFRFALPRGGLPSGLSLDLK